MSEAPEARAQEAERLLNEYDAATNDHALAVERGDVDGLRKAREIANSRRLAIITLHDRLHHRVLDLEAERRGYDAMIADLRSCVPARAPTREAENARRILADWDELMSGGPAADDIGWVRDQGARVAESLRALLAARRNCPQTPITVTVPADLSHSGGATEKTVDVDACVAPIVAALHAAGVEVRGSCCGHGGTGEILLGDNWRLVRGDPEARAPTREALRKYGQHLPNCIIQTFDPKDRSGTGCDFQTPPCDCGFDAALLAARPDASAIVGILLEHRCLDQDLGLGTVRCSCGHLYHATPSEWAAHAAAALASGTEGTTP